jgi:hypothetical protein
LFNSKSDTDLYVYVFSEDNLAEVLSNDYTPKEVISSKNHFIYLKEYLGSAEINAQTIVVEENYISKDFLHDYASYYAQCFESYPKYCRRVHFFNKSFGQEEFETIIIGEESENKDFWATYLGFIVVKPIPVTVIGYTVLKTYIAGENFESRNFWGIRKYTIHIFGNLVEIESLAFQEQDSVLSACATTAIWSMLNKASIDFHTILKSPSQITKDADNVSPDGSRLFPNKGLNLLQICQAILNSGLVSEIKQPDYEIKDANGNFLLRVVSNQYLKKILNAYSPIGIPIILVVNVPNGSNYGLHAITVSGFKQKNPVPITPTNIVSWLSDNIEKFYAHDDQWGPFARIDFKNDAELVTPWSIFSGNNSPTYLTNIVVPLYLKIRISYEDIEAIVLGLDAILTLFFDNLILADLVWDIRIDYSENYKSELKKSSLINSKKLDKLKIGQPKYLWIASCYVSEFKILQFTFDATDVRSGMIGRDLISFLPIDINNELKQHLILNKNLHERLFQHTASIKYYQFLIDNI